MKIIWRGHSCFQIIGSSRKDKKPLSIVIDPFSEEIGLKLSKMEADILLVTHDHYDHNNIKAVSGAAEKTPFLINNPGEYDVEEAYIQGIPTWHDNSKGQERGRSIIYTIKTEDFKICHLGDLGQKELSEKEVEEIGEVDILMIPIGGGPTIDAKDAAKVISQIEPKIAIPMHYSLPKLKIKLDELDLFLKVMGKKDIQPEDKLIVKKKDLPEDSFQLIVLNPS
ncbi:MAG: MBL fold metallo-hydrolase [Candidatus Paceibacterota bacterium]|jgi:L-ascorbate metabolism protein UlaG (beta-lactamase superfamily)|nr:MBL fold metallo-hydrolase [Candidatus Paceibacterota bacterium]MDD4830673.1 MBL fold metallo-hydrolase [Candidatus Paceibacterota bacterium]MDD4875247.1 MBL fold metallo-hydrolase [Candidatus Paceibacterota bacterium]